MKREKPTHIATSALQAALRAHMHASVEAPGQGPDRATCQTCGGDAPKGQRTGGSHVCRFLGIVTRPRKPRRYSKILQEAAPHRSGKHCLTCAAPSSRFVPIRLHMRPAVDITRFGRSGSQAGYIPPGHACIAGASACHPSFPPVRMRVVGSAGVRSQRPVLQGVARPPASAWAS